MLQPGIDCFNLHLDAFETGVDSRDGFGEFGHVLGQARHTVGDDLDVGAYGFDEDRDTASDFVDLVGIHERELYHFSSRLSRRG